jgi:hypothetical protein
MNSKCSVVVEEAILEKNGLSTHKFAPPIP